MSGSGISWAVCKSAPRSRQISTPAPDRSVFYRPDALPAAQPTVSKHWRHLVRHLAYKLNQCLHPVHTRQHCLMAEIHTYINLCTRHAQIMRHTYLSLHYIILQLWKTDQVTQKTESDSNRSNTQKTVYYFTASKSTFLKFRNFKLVRQRYVAKMLLCQRYQFTVVNSCQQRQHLTLKFTMQIQNMLTQHLQQHANKQVQQRQPPFYCHYKVDLH